jgi:hypothetical protein
MKRDEGFRTRIVQAMGTVMMFTWILILGPVGVLLLGGAAYFMQAKNSVAVASCGVLFLFPLLLTVAWGVMRSLELFRERRVRREAVLPVTEPMGSPTR